MGASETGTMAAASNPTGLIDTDILIDAGRGFPDAASFLGAQHAAAGTHISIISAMELVAGCRNATELAHVQQFLRVVTLEPVTSAISQTALRAMETFYLSHGLLIAD